MEEDLLAGQSGAAIGSNSLSRNFFNSSNFNTTGITGTGLSGSSLSGTNLNETGLSSVSSDRLNPGSNGSRSLLNNASSSSNLSTGSNFIQPNFDSPLSSTDRTGLGSTGLLTFGLNDPTLNSFNTAGFNDNGLTSVRSQLNRSGNLTFSDTSSGFARGNLSGNFSNTAFASNPSNSLENSNGQTSNRFITNTGLTSGSNGSFNLLSGSTASEPTRQVLGNNRSNRLTGGRNDDVLAGFDGNDRLSGGRGNDVLAGGRGNDTLTGQQGRDQILGEAGNDVLTGNSGNDILAGGNGRDVLIAGRNLDRLLGGPGIDTFVLQTGSGNAVIEDFQAARDRLDLPSTLNFGSLTLTSQGQDTLVNAGSDLLAVLRNTAPSSLSSIDS